MPVPSITILEFLRNANNSSGWPSSNIDILILHVSEVANVGFLHIFTLMVCVARSSSNSKLISGIGGGFISSCKSVRSYGPLFVVKCLDLVVWSVFTAHIVTLQSSVCIILASIIKK